MNRTQNFKVRLAGDDSLVRVLDVVHWPVQLLLQLDLNGLLFRVVVLLVHAQDGILELVLAVGSLVLGDVLRVLVMMLDRVDRALDLNDLDVCS